MVSCDNRNESENRCSMYIWYDYMMIYSDINVYLNGEVILQVDSVKYLGHHLTNDLHDDLDIRRQWRASH